MSTPHGKIQACVPLYLNHPSKYPIVSDFFNSMKLYPEIELIVIDDCSPLPLFPQWPVWSRNEVNKGFTYSVNRGLSCFTGDVVLVLNDDLKIKEGDLDELSSIKEVGIYYPRDSASGNVDCFGAIWGMTRETWLIMGFMDESMPHYGSDRLYYDKALKLGVPVVKINSVCIEHKERSTYKNIIVV